MVNNSNISVLVIKRLVALWFMASFAVGGIVSYVEFESIDDEVIQLGLRQAYSIDPFLIERLPQNLMEDTIILQEFVNRLTMHEYVVAEIYSEDQIHRAAAVRVGNASVNDAVDAKQHQFPLDRKLHYEKFHIDDVMYIQILVPLKTRVTTYGYFEGVYKVDKVVIDEIMSRLYRTLAIVLIVILATFVMLYPVIIFLNRQLLSFSNDLFKANIELMEVMGSAIAKRDSTTDTHNYRVTLYALRFAEALKLTPVQICRLIAGSFLHDVGKIGIEDGILRKNGRLDEHEFRRMKEHVLIGIDIVAKADWLHGAREVIEFHHEKYDGSGYMRGLDGENIPLNARIFAIVDVFDALCSERPYKPAYPLEKVIEMMTEERGKHFDPKLLDKFLALAPDLHKKIGMTGHMNLTQMLSTAVRKHFFDARLK